MRFLIRHPIIVVLILFLFGVQLSSQDYNDTSKDSFFSGIVLRVTYYPQKFVNYTTDKVVTTWQNYMEIVDVNKENAKLKEEIRILKQQNFALKEVERQNVRLTKLLELTEATPYPVVSANVIAGSPSAIRSEVIIIDKGSSDGLRTGMPVASLGGVVGRVFMVGKSSSEVILITDPLSAVDAYVHRTRARGIVKGNGNQCVMEYVEKMSDVSKGDKIISSGKDGFFPKGVLIGTVHEINADGGFVNASVVPHMDLNSLEEVVIILKTVDNIVLNE